MVNTDEESKPKDKLSLMKGTQISYINIPTVMINRSFESPSTMGN